MSSSRTKTPIALVHTGVPGLDAVLGGGLPQYSFNLIAGGPGAGKTTLAQQIVFSNASVERPAIYFTVLGEPSLKMLRHVQQYAFFDADKFNSAVRFVNLSAEALEQDLGKLLERISIEIQSLQPGLVVVDSFRTITRAGTSEAQIQEFVQRLAIQLTSWEATTFLVGEYELAESHNPIFTVADGILWLTQTIERNACIRQMQVTKSRASATIPGLHTFVISANGIRVFPRVLPRTEAPASRGDARASTGVQGLDAMMNGGIPLGETTMIVGPSGSGKSTLARHFIASGATSGERSVIAVFEEHPGEYLARSDSFGAPIRSLIERKQVEILSLRPLDLSVEETLADIRDAIDRTDAKRLVIDSISGFELTLAPLFRDDFRESLFRMVSALAGRGVTTLVTVSLVESYTELGLSPYITEFLADTLVLLRYVELGGKLEKILAVVKMRNSSHDHAIRRYSIDASGVTIGGPVHGFRGVLTGMPILTALGDDEAGRGVAEPEAALLQRVLQQVSGEISQQISQQIRGLGEASMATLSRLGRIPRSSVTATLKRLRQLGYTVRTPRRGRVTIGEKKR
jgi:circadian clock protein KaiC